LKDIENCSGIAAVQLFVVLHSEERLFFIFSAEYSSSLLSQCRKSQCRKVVFHLSSVACNMVTAATQAQFDDFRGWFLSLH